ncbi:MAG TPA: hypothetical protein VHQ90_15230 [Thermoanaerobaculia bacterium]|nr:hypothetical protein [Thermoanaerobaculia bacterium]
MRFVSAVAAQLLLLLAGQAAAQPALASEVGHTLSGIVSDLPPEVEPGETIQLQVLDETKLPPGGTFSLAGVVVDTDPPPEGQAVALTPPADPAARPGPESLGALAAVLASENDACGGLPEPQETAVVKSKSNITNNRTRDPSSPPPAPEPQETGVVRSKSNITNNRMRDPGSPPPAPEPQGTAVVRSKSNITNNRMRDPSSPRSVYDVDVVAKTVESSGAATPSLQGSVYAVDAMDLPQPAGAAGVPIDEPGLKAYQVRRVETAAAAKWFAITSPDGRAERRIGLMPSRPGAAGLAANGCVVLVAGAEPRATNPQRAAGSPGPGRYATVAVGRDPSALRSRHDVAMSAIRNIKARIAAAKPGATEKSFFESRSNYAKRTAEGLYIEIGLPKDLKPGTPLSATIKDASGKTLVDVPETPAVHVVPPGPAEQGPRITAATRHVLAGGPACVCGYFPSARAWEGITVDGRSAYPSTASLRTVLLPTSTTTATGPHEVAGAVAAGYPSASHAQFTVVTIGGKIDASVLRKGGTTEMELWVSGTTDPMELRVQNLTPSIIRVDGGNDQKIVTSGGTPNRLSRRVTGIVAGAFNINYVLAEDRCPCAPKSGRPAPASGR